VPLKLLEREPDSSTTHIAASLAHSAPEIGRAEGDLRVLRYTCWFIAVALAAMPVWVAINKHSMNADGIAYLDIGDAYLSGDWQTAINPVWSPLYSWLLGLVLWALNPPMRWEFPVVHVINLLIYLGALVCFDYFWRGVVRYHRNRNRPGMAAVTLEESATRALPEWAWLGFGYGLFIWCSLSLIEIWAVTPDMLLSAFIYLAGGLILRMRLGLATQRTYVLLGATLGLAYLAKAVMFPLAFVFLAVALFSAEAPRRSAPLVLTSLLTFLLVSLPFIALISSVKGRLTFGEAGTLTYLRHVNDIPYPHWQGETPEFGTPAHPARQILDMPPIFEFGEPIGGTYPLSHDPSYWYEGAIARIDVSKQVRAWLSSALFYFDLFFRQMGAWTAAVLMLYVMSRWRGLGVVDFIRQWGLSIIALGAMGAYALVYVEGRYVGPFLALLWADLLANVRLPRSEAMKRLAWATSGMMIAFTMANLAAFNLEGLSRIMVTRPPTEIVVPQARPPRWPGEVAEELHRLGVKRGDKVALIGYGFDSYWARLARVKIVAELPERQAEQFWRSDASRQREALSAFATTGARAVIAEHVPPYASPHDWHRVNDTNFYIYLLPR
jgi:hypothetical protein